MVGQLSIPLHVRSLLAPARSPQQPCEVLCRFHQTDTDPAPTAAAGTDASQRRRPANQYRSTFVTAAATALQSEQITESGFIASLSEPTVVAIVIADEDDG